MGNTSQFALSTTAGSGLRIAVVVSRFNETITEKLFEGCFDTLKSHGVEPSDITVAWVPGAFEIPFAVRQFIESENIDAVIAIGAVIRGETPHFDLVAGESARALMDLNMLGIMPVINGIITTNDGAQAEARAGGSAGHKGEEAAIAALEMVSLARMFTPDDTHAHKHGTGCC